MVFRTGFYYGRMLAIKAYFNVNEIGLDGFSGIGI